MDALISVLQRIESTLEKIERQFPASTTILPDWQASIAFRWRKKNGIGYLQAVSHVATIQLSELKHIDMPKELIAQNTRQFVQGRPANNVLLTGARGTGKSSLIKACLNQFSKQKLRLIEVDKSDLVDLADIIELIEGRPEYFIIYCDDLSFEEGESSYKALKSALDGSICAQTDNVLIYATSNRRHLLPEYMKENLSYTHTAEGEVHPGDVVEEKISLSDRFGLWVNFYGFSQEEYLSICESWLSSFGVQADEGSQRGALQWALERGSRSGRVASQFARDWVGKMASKKPPAKKSKNASPLVLSASSSKNGSKPPKSKGQPKKTKIAKA
jgi:predicted AAA+ superfamily ATPase